MNPSLRQLAAKANAAEELDTNDFDVFAHGTCASFAGKLISTQGGCLSETGGRWSGDFYTVSDVAIATIFAKRSSQNVNEKPAVVGIALPNDVVKHLRQIGLLSSPPIQGPPAGVPPNTPQVLFKRGALDTLKKSGFFFSIS